MRRRGAGSAQGSAAAAGSEAAAATGTATLAPSMSGTRASNDRSGHPAAGGLKRARSEPGGNKVTVVLGAQWGDEGKGKVVDLLATESDIVCRCQVGAGPALSAPPSALPHPAFPPAPAFPRRPPLVRVPSVCSLLLRLSSLQRSFPPAAVLAPLVSSLPAPQCPSPSLSRSQRRDASVPGRAAHTAPALPVCASKCRSERKKPRAININS